MSKHQTHRLRRQLRQKLRREKRGVVLLVVVSLLTLFLMIGVTYVLIAGNYRNASDQALRAHRFGDEPEREAEEILGQILYGSMSPSSVLGPHSLLGDLYGNDGVIIGTDGQPVTIHPVNPGLTTYNAGQSLYFQVSQNFQLNPIPNYYAGRVITFTNGPAAGLSTRVMAYYPAGISGSGPTGLMVEMPESDLPIPVQPGAGTRFVINGAPFNGTGAGYDPVNQQNLNALITLNYTGTPNPYGVAYLPNAGILNLGNGGLDESWDAADYQNPFLSFVPPRKLSQFDGFPLLPSYHRPDLVRFWIQSLQRPGGLLSGVNDMTGQTQSNYFVYPYGIDGIRDGAPGDNAAGNPDRMQFTLLQADELVALKRMIVMRPLREDHPNFTGGNQNFREDSLQGPYDVDNDGDGITDSIWVDAGLPVITAPNGRRYKRLVAVLIKDLDGRVNPSVHGNMALANIPNTRTSFQVTDTFAGMDPSGPNPIFLPRGLGYGPAEVDFRHIVNDDNAAYVGLLSQRYFPNVSGQMAFPGFSDGNPANLANHDGWSNLRMMGMPGINLNMGNLQLVNRGDHTNLPLSAYSTPPDVWGRAAIAVDYTGQPIWGFAGTAERVDNPYEIQWDQLRASVDVPYTVSELEALLRYHDLGAAAIPSRLMQLAGNYLGLGPTDSRGTPSSSQFARESFGIGSYIPSPRLSVPRELRSSVPNAVGSSTILDLYAYRLSGNMNEFQTIVPFEFLKGQMFNLNRELGNGVDDNGNGVVDDPSEFGSEIIPTPPTNPPSGPYALDYRNDTPVANTPDQRHMYARHLYCLAMFLRNANAPHTIDLDGDGSGSPPETARYYAQWAVNVVDFRDADSIMTPFEYDINPFNGWNVDGVIGTVSSPSPDDTSLERGLVWGCERPELLITETVNGHDRRTEDLDDDGPNMNNRKVADPERDGTNDFDQRLKPQGWTYIELYNPWHDRSNNIYDHKPQEIYRNGGVDISLVNNFGSPVWRMLVVRGPNKNEDPDYPRPEALTVDNGGNPLSGSGVERSIYFADLAGGGVNRPSGDGEAYFPSSAIFGAGTPRIPPIVPGRYAVIGSAGDLTTVAGGNYSVNLGWRSTESGPPSRPTINPRQIILNPGAGTIRVTNNQTDGADDTTSANLQSVVAVPVDRVMRGGVDASQSLTISEPVGDYPAQVGWVAPTATEEGYYSPAIDGPFDVARTDNGNIFASDRTEINYRVLHLQRLANPLLAWEPFTNPYMTVDTSSMDVMSYNGVTDDSMDPQLGGAGRQNFQSFQRGGRFYDSDVPEMVTGYTTPTTPRLFRDLWAQESPFLAPSTDSPTETSAEPHYQTRPLYHTLGGLNRRYYPYFGAGAPAAYRGAPYFQDSNNVTASPFPYLTFNNRPFNNPMELLQVPAWSSSKLLAQFGGQYLDPATPTWTTLYRNPPASQLTPFGHLPNFFHTSDDPLSVNSSYSQEFSRILDYVETRTPYIDTEKYYNPAAFVTGNTAPAGFRPPFNYLSRFREPGRININTIFDSNVWDAAVRGFPGMCTLNPPNEGDGGFFLSHLILSRQGYGSTPADMLQHNPMYPSLFSQPFRTADSADIMPPNPNADPSNPNDPLHLRKVPANGSLLRRDANQYPPPVVDVDRPLFASDNTLPYQDAARNPYFRYQGLQKVGNLFSTNSNCYAVWITVGYFEVESNGTPPVIDQAHPEGVRLAGEVGVDEGNVKRHRAFYIIDRSIPVGYEPGHRHNTDKAVLLKRFIE